MGLKRYDVVVNGHATTLKLDDAEARRLGVLVEEKQAARPANKARTVRNKATEPKPATPPPAG